MKCPYVITVSIFAAKKLCKADAIARTSEPSQNTFKILLESSLFSDTENGKVEATQFLMRNLKRSETQ